VTFLQPQRYTESAIKKTLLLGHSSLDLAPPLAGLFIERLASGAESPGIGLAANVRWERFRPAAHPNAIGRSPSLTGGCQRDRLRDCFPGICEPGSATP